MINILIIMLGLLFSGLGAWMVLGVLFCAAPIWWIAAAAVAIVAGLELVCTGNMKEVK